MLETMSEIYPVVSSGLNIGGLNSPPLIPPIVSEEG